MAQCISHNTVHTRSQTSSISPPGQRLSAHIQGRRFNFVRTRADSKSKPARFTCLVASDASVRTEVCSNVFRSRHRFSSVNAYRTQAVAGSASSSDGADAQPEAVPPPEEKKQGIAALTSEAWFAFFGCVLMNFLLGSFYCWSVYLPGMEAALGVGRALLSSVFSVATICFTIALSYLLPAVMAVQVPAGGGLMALLSCVAGLLVSALAITTNQLPLLFIGYALGFGAGSGLAYGITVQMGGLKLFSSCKGLATGCIVSARAMGAVAFAPIIKTFIQDYGLVGALQLQAALLLVIGALPSYLLLRGSGITVPLAAGKAGKAPQGLRAPLPQQLWGALKSVFVPSPPPVAAGEAPLYTSEAAQVWLLRGVLGMGCFAGLMTISHAATLLYSVGGTAAAAAAGVSLINAFSAAGRIGGGWVADRWSPIKVLIVVPLLGIPALIAGALAPSVLTAQVALAGAGLSYGALAIIVPVHVNRTVGSSNFARVYGQIFLSWGTAGLLAPWLAGYFFEQYKNYSITLLLAACASLGASVCSYLVHLRTDSLPDQNKS